MIKQPCQAQNTASQCIEETLLHRDCGREGAVEGSCVYHYSEEYGCFIKNEEKFFNEYTFNITTSSNEGSIKQLTPKLTSYTTLNPGFSNFFVPNTLNAILTRFVTCPLTRPKVMHCSCESVTTDIGLRGQYWIPAFIDDFSSVEGCYCQWQRFLLGGTIKRVAVWAKCIARASPL